MAAPFRAPRGTRDLFPEDLVVVRHLEAAARAVARRYRYAEVRPPLFEETRLFARSLGETSDVVTKEMFTVPSRAEEGESYTFRPEGTAGVARAYVEGGFPARAPFQKWFYLGPMFRYERPQKGRERQFSQFGVEVFGSASPLLDAEVVDLACRFFDEVGLRGRIEVRASTMGDPEDRARWADQLRSFFAPQMARRCPDCRERFERNVFRLLDCKAAACRQLNAGAPAIRGALGPEATRHFDALRRALSSLGRGFAEDPSMVRGLDYYTRTVFEIHYPPLGARSALCGGGRYDGLVEEVGGPPTPAVGFAIGFTATELALADLGLPRPEDLEALRAELRAGVYVVAVGDEDRLDAAALAAEFRSAGLPGVDLDYRHRSARAQFKEADRLGARLVAVVGADERAAGEVRLRDMTSGEERTVPRCAAVGAAAEALARAGGRPASGA